MKDTPNMNANELILSLTQPQRKALSYVIEGFLTFSSDPDKLMRKSLAALARGLRSPENHPNAGGFTATDLAVLHAFENLTYYYPKNGRDLATLKRAWVKLGVKGTILESEKDTEARIRVFLLGLGSARLECTSCHRMFWSGTGHPTLAICRACWKPQTPPPADEPITVKKGQPWSGDPIPPPPSTAQDLGEACSAVCPAGLLAAGERCIAVGSHRQHRAVKSGIGGSEWDAVTWEAEHPQPQADHHKVQEAVTWEAEHPRDTKLEAVKRLILAENAFLIAFDWIPGNYPAEDGAGRSVTRYGWKPPPGYLEHKGVKPGDEFYRDRRHAINSQKQACFGLAGTHRVHVDPEHWDLDVCSECGGTWPKGAHPIAQNHTGTCSKGLTRS